MSTIIKPKGGQCRRMMEKYWDYSRNKGLTPDMFSVASYKKVWWKCKRGHNWQDKIRIQIRKEGCPLCRVYKNSLAVNFKGLLKEWDYVKNKIDPRYVFKYGAKKVWWKCKDNPRHKWRDMIRTRTWDDHQCPICKIPLKKSIFKKDKRLQKLWHPTKNGKLTTIDITPHGHKKVWWKCKKGHEWKESPHALNGRMKNRVNGGLACSFCSGRKTTTNNCLFATHPHLLKEWNYAKNKIDPNTIRKGCNKKVWWKCKKGHEWPAKICERTMGRGCPMCRGVYLKNGEKCDSLIEAYYYLLFKNQGKKFIHDSKYKGLKKT